MISMCYRFFVPEVASVTEMAFIGMSDPVVLSASQHLRCKSGVSAYQAERGSKKDSTADHCRGQKTIAGVMMWSLG